MFYHMQGSVATRLTTDVIFCDHFITGPPTHSVGGQYCFALWRLSSSSVTFHGGPAGGFTRNRPGDDVMPLPV